MGNKKVTAINVRMETTGMSEVNAYVDGIKQPYVMHMIVTGQDGNWPDYTITTNFGLALTRTSKWDIERNLEGSEFQKLAMAMFEIAYSMNEANKPEPVKEEEPDAESDTESQA